MSKTWAPVAVLVGLLASALGIVALAADSARHNDASGVGLAWVLIAVSFGASGLIARARRPDNPVGTMLVAVGFGFVVGNLELSDVAVLYSIGLALDTVWIGLLVHTLAIYPTGRFDSRAAIGFAAGGWLTTVALQLAETVVWDPAMQGCEACPRNLFAAAASESAASVVAVIQGPVLGSITVALGVATFAIRWRRASIVSRRTIVPPLATGMVALVLIVVALFVEEVGGAAATLADLAAGAAVFAIPASLLLGVLRTQITHTRIGDLAVRLAEPLNPEQLRSALASAVEDPTLTVAYWAPQIDHYVDGRGARLNTLEAPDRSTDYIHHDGKPVAAISYDAALDNSPGLVKAVAATATLALDNERLRAELRAQLADLQDSRARIIAAEDAERRRLERNLHDGAQQRLLGLGLALQLARSQVDDPTAVAGILDEADTELRNAITQLRDLAHGLHPALLTESGLEAAIEDLARRAPFPVAVDLGTPTTLASSLEAVAYYVVAEALANAAKHARPTRGCVRVIRQGDSLEVTVTDDGAGGADPTGSGLTGLADRVAGAGGTLTVHSPNRAGTRITAELPCE